MNAEKIKKIQIFLLVIACIMFIVGLVLSTNAEKARAHDVEDIDVVIVNDYTEDSGNRFYVYTDFKITNNTKKTLEYLQVVTYFTDKNGKAIGTMTSDFGSRWDWDTGLLLDAGQSVTKTTYLEEYYNWGSLFEHLYENGVSSYDVRYEITYARWEDGYEWFK